MAGMATVTATEADAKTVVVTGAAGIQGTAVVRALLAAPGPARFRVRAVVGDPNSAKAQQLVALQGVEIVSANFDNVESLRRAFTGADYAFVNTDYWATEPVSDLGVSLESAHIRTLADVCKEVGVQHVVCSTLDDSCTMLPAGAAPVLQGEDFVPQHDAKGSSYAHFMSIGLNTTFLLSSAYYENLLGLFRPHKDQNGILTLEIGIGQHKMAMISVDDIGNAAAAILSNPTAFLNTYVAIYTELLSGEEIAAAIADAIGVPTVFRPIDTEVLRASGTLGAQELANMFTFWQHSSESTISTRSNSTVWDQLHVRPKPFAQWVREHASTFASM